MAKPATDRERAARRAVGPIQLIELEPAAARSIAQLTERAGVPALAAYAAAIGILVARLAGQKELSLEVGGGSDGPASVRIDLVAQPTFLELVVAVAAALRDGPAPLAPARDTPLAIQDSALGPIAAEIHDSTQISLRAELLDQGRLDEVASQLVLVLEALARTPEARAEACSLVTLRGREIIADPTVAIAAPAHDPVTVTISDLRLLAPEAPAMEWRGEVWTRARLALRATAISAALRGVGVKRGDRVVVTGPRGPAIAAGLLAVWRCGAVIIPLSESLPLERRRMMAREGAAAAILTVGNDDLAWELPVVRTRENGEVLGIAGGVEPLVADEPLGRGERVPAYVFFTSGTTGTPKGVLGTHDGLAHFLRWQRETFGITSSDRAAQLTGLSFDVVMRDMMMPLGAGATLCFPEREAASMDPEALHDWLASARITIMHSVPSVLESWLVGWRGLSPLTSLRLLFMAGEPLSATLVRECRVRFPNCRVVNLYGPTETTLAKCFIELPRELASGTQPVGRPMTHTQALVMNEGVRCGLGEMGEIVIRTPFRTLGYLGESARASGRFRPNPFRDDPDDLLYATGDLGRYQLDGTLEIHGRVDDQVKIQGVRVQPAEVAAVIRSLPDVASCFVAVFADRSGRKALCAYVVPRGALPGDASALRRELAERLPAALVPSSFTFLERLPLSANGKVDRKALPSPAAGRTVPHAEPTSATERMLADVWAAVLRIDTIGIDDNFFDLGGQSLAAAQVFGRLRKERGVELPVRALFEHPTIALLAPIVDAQRGPTTTKPELRRTGEDQAAVSSAEARLWFLDQLEPAQATYNLPLVLRLRGALDVAALEDAVTMLAARHDGLRTRFAGGPDGPRRIVEHAKKLVLERVAFDAGVDAEAARRRAIAGLTARPFDLEHGPLFRAALLRVGPDDHYLVLAMHHVVSDGLSLAILERDLFLFYEARRRGQPPQLVELPFRLADHAVWQRERLTGGLLEEQLAYWRQNLEGAPASLDLPVDRPRPPVQRHRGGRVRVVLAPETSALVSELARREGATPFMVLLAVFDVLLARHTGRKDIVVGIPAANRSRAELEGMVGFFVNTLAVRTKLDGEPTVSEVIQRVKAATLGAHEHQDVPFERLVEELRPPRDPSRTPLFQVMFAHQVAGEGTASIDGLAISVEPDELEISKFDLTLNVDDRPGALDATLQYDSDLFDRATAERLAGRYGVLLGAALARPDVAVSRLALMSRAELADLEQWSATTRQLPEPQAFHQLFEDQAARWPGRIAVTLDDATLTYAELDARANDLAHHLRDRGVGRDVIVGVCMDRSLEMVIALYAVLKAGGAYAPLDPHLPPDRLAFMTRDLEAQVVLTQRAGSVSFDTGRAEVIVVDAEGELLGRARPAVTFERNQLAYVIYTSGSTGTPKAATNTHAGLRNRLLWMQHAYGLDAEDRVLQKTPFTFDVSVWELFWPLAYGARLVMARPEGHKDPAYLAEVFARAKITTAHFVPSMLQAFLEEPSASLASLARVICSGEALPRLLAARFHERIGCELHNLYGPTEASIDVTFWSCERDDLREVPIGRPIWNTQIHVVDENGVRCPIGVAGEIWIGGIGVGRGYWRRPALTAEKFIPDPFTPGGRVLYRSGDLGRYRADGAVEYLGRLDHQVKVRGFRIELGEIEAAIAAAPSVREVAVVAREDSAGDKRLVAYVVGDEVDLVAIGTDLRKRLPDYMVPAVTVILERFPLTSSGKLDRKALPAPDFASKVEFVAPRSTMEQRVAALWQELLGRDRVGAHDDFFALGGHSLLATRVAVRLRSALGVDVRVRTLFELTTLAALAAHLEKAEAETAVVPLARVPRTGVLAASSAQERLWFLAQLDPTSATYNVDLVLRLRGRVDVAALARSVDALVQRHEVLRTTLAAADGAPRQVIHDAVDVSLTLAKASNEHDLAALVRAEIVRPFDLERGPLMRTTLVRRREDEHVFVLVMHHVVTDGWSVAILERELSQLYEAFRAGRPALLPPLLVQYADYAAWQRASLADSAAAEPLQYWKAQLREAPTTLDLPTDRPRPPVKGHGGATVRFELPRSLVTGIADLALSEGATTFMVLLAAFDLLLARQSGQEDIVVGTPVANRPRAELESIVGFFVNTLAFRTSLAGRPSFRELIRRVKQTSLGALEHQDVPFERLVEALRPARDPSRTPIFQVMFAHERARSEPLRLAGLEVTVEPTALDVAKFDLSLTTEEAADAMRGSFEYDNALFDRISIERLAEQLTVLLVAAVESPDRAVSLLPMMSATAEQHVLRLGAGAPTAFDDAPVHEQLARRTASCPDALAVADDSVSLTYAELDRRANGVARELHARGVRPEARVATWFTRSADMIVALLAVLKAGAVIVPLDPVHPVARLRFIVGDVGAALVLSTRAVSQDTDLGVPVIELGDLAAADADASPALAGAGRRAAYVIYTSGTTGQPKGTVLEHRGLSNLVSEHLRLTDLRASDRVAQISSPAFDATTSEIWPTLLVGASLHIVSDEVRLSSEALVTSLRERRITVADMPTPLLEAALDEDWADSRLRVLSTGGQALRRRGRGDEPFQLINVYGPTETTNYVTTELVEPGAHPVTTIGRPIQNTTIRILDVEGLLVPPGVYGELCVGGLAVSRGYFGQPAGTAERFVPDVSAAGARLYRTGDRARWLTDGRIELAGRYDDQVKIRGFRIELGEVESAVRRLAAVRDAVVVAREERPGIKRIVAYVVPRAGIAVDAQAARRELSRTLPEYMLPAIVLLDALPVTANGKVDRKALPAPDLRRAGPAHVAPRTTTEKAIAAIWRDVLGTDRIGVDDDFFAMGGHSLLATRVASRLRSALGVEVPVRLLFDAPTLGALAARLSGPPAPALDAISRRSPDEPLVASFAQDRLWFLGQLTPDAPTYNVPLVLRIRGPLDATALTASIRELVRRHEVLRTTFDGVDGRPQPVVHEVLEPSFDVEAVANEEAAQACLHAEVSQPFDLSNGPLLRVRLLALGPVEHILLVVVHHIATDGWSMAVLEHDLASLYNAAVQRSAAPLAPGIRYADFAAWQRRQLTGDRLARQVAYWREHLDGAPAALELATDRPRPPVKRHLGASVRLDLAAEVASRVARAARETGTTPFMVLLAVFDVLIARRAGLEDIVVGTPIANRTRAELEGLVGFFVNTLALRTSLAGDPTFREVLQRVKRAALGAYDHQDLPFEKLVEELRPRRDPSRTPIFEVMFSHQVETPRPVFDGLVVSPEPDGLEVAKFDLTLFIEEREGQLQGSLQYDRDLFEASTIERMAEGYGVLLEAALGDLDQHVGRLPVMSREERHRVVVQWNATQHAQPLDSCIDALFDEQVARAPDAPALVHGAETMTYGELAEASHRVAAGLRAAGVGPGARVGISSERSLDLVIGLLGILRVGAAYVPLDPAYPQDRIELLVNEADVEVVVDPQGRVRLPRHVSTVGTSELREQGPPSTGTAEARRSARDTAQVLFTSGSTGTPKGVCIEHHAVVRLVRGATWSTLGAGDVVLAYAPLSFDASTLEIWGALLNGAKLVIARAGMLALEELAALVREQRITFLFLTAGLFHQMVDQDLAALAGVRQLLSGGDVLSPGHVRRVRLELPSVTFLNCYGPTENGVVTTAHRVVDLAEHGSVPIGRPITNTTVYILDAGGEPTPIGVPGELYTGGAGLARGYVRAATTAEKFVPDPFSAERGARLYRTGDQARWRADGTLEFLGRRDGQVKLRGFRIELGEVESAVARAPGVREAVVIAREDLPGDKRLVAYVVASSTSLGLDELRASVRRALPDHMVPSAFVVLDAIPLTTTGKIDRRALPVPDLMAAAAEYVAPRNRIEENIAEIWCRVLGLERVGARDDFFALGGHSLLATRVASQLRVALGLVVPVGWLFEAPVLEALAQRVAAARAVGTMPPAPRSHAGVGPLRASFAQERMWFLAQLEPNAATYNVPLVLKFRAPFDVGGMASSIEEIVRRHESLRTSLVESDGLLYQVVHPSVHVPLVANDAVDDAAARALIREEVARPFDLAQVPVLRATMIRLANGDHVLVLVMHHVATDGWSIEVIRRELRALSSAFTDKRRCELRALPIQYADYAAWQRERLLGPLLATQLGYWRTQLEGAPTSLDLPTDRPRPSVKRYRGGTVRLDLPRGTVSRVAALAKREGATPFMVLLAAFDVVLGRHAGQDDVVVGTPVANRSRPEVEDLVGFFANTLPLRTKLDGQPTFRGVVQRVKQSVFGAFQHEDVPFERLVEELKPPRDTSRTPIFQAMFTHTRTMPPPPGPRARLVSVESSELEVSKFDLTLSLEENRGELEGALEYDSDLFDRSTAERTAERFGILLTAALDAPDTMASDLPMMSESEQHQVVIAWNATHRPHDGATLLHELFEQQAARTPDALAVQDDLTRLSYRELDARAESVAAWLVGHGVQPEARVAVTVARSVDMIAAVLGVLKVGAAYVPVDPKLPEDRRTYMTRDAGCVATLDDATLAAALATTASRRVLGNSSARGLAYILYTSGSTGRPKGVMVEHRGVVNLVRSLLRDPGMKTTDVELALTTLSFDVAGAEIFVPLAAGASVVVASEEAARDPELLTALIARTGANVAGATPATWRMLTSTGWRPPATMSIHCAGEALPSDLAQDLVQNGASLVNLYGPTETTIYATAARVVAGQRITIGRPLDNTQTYVLDASLRPVPPGVVGELFIAGTMVARGYLGQPALTAERFVPDPFSNERGARMYATGDRACWLQDGTLDYLGRTDHQVKVRGFRIELGEIETTLRSVPGVRDAIVVARDHGPGDQRLVAYVTPAELSTESLKQSLRLSLPEYMVPSAFVSLPALPLTATAKVDRGSLPAPDFASSASPHLAPRTATERALAEIWCEVLGIARLGRDDDFFALGGHSLMAVRLVAAIREQLGHGVPLALVFERSTVAGLADAIDGGVTRAARVVRLSNGTGVPVIVCIAPIGGELTGYSQLAAALGPSAFVLGIRARGLVEDEAPLDTVEAIAAEHVALLRERQPGPYILVGWSFGGVVAFEMARQLHALDQCARVVAVDSYPAVSAVRGSGAELLVAYLADLMRSRRAAPLPLTADGGVDAVWTRAVLSGYFSEGEVSLLRRTFTVYEANDRAYSAYRPAPAPVFVRWIRAAGSVVDVDTDAAREQWRWCASDGVEETSLDADHYSIMRDPHVNEIVRAIACAQKATRTNGTDEEGRG